VQHPPNNRLINDSVVLHLGKKGGDCDDGKKEDRELEYVRERGKNGERDLFPEEEKKSCKILFKNDGLGINGESRRTASQGEEEERRRERFPVGGPKTRKKRNQNKSKEKRRNKEERK